MSADTLNGKVVLISGAARRIGAAIAKTMHDNGARVAIHYRNSADAAAALADEMNAARPGSAMIIQADLHNTGGLPDLVGQVTSWHQRLDVLVNNASTFYPTAPGTITERDWDDLVGSNLKAPLFLCQAAWPALQQSRGSIVNILDIHATRPLRNYSVYGSAKAGLAMLTRSLAKDFAPEVRVNGVAPGAILWPEDEMSEDTKASILRQIPLGRQGAPDDIATCILYLVRDAGYVTGQIIAIDGGRSIGW